MTRAALADKLVRPASAKRLLSKFVGAEKLNALPHTHKAAGEKVKTVKCSPGDWASVNAGGRKNV